MTQAIPEELQRAFEREREQSQQDARRNRTPAASRGLTIRMYGRLAELQTSTIARHAVQVACERGCNYCCHLRVEIRPHEAFVLAQHIQSTFSEAQRAHVMARIDENRRRIASLSAEQHNRAGIPCALLEDGVCAAYDGRPAACRKYYSVSVDTCRDVFNDPSAPRHGPIEDDQVRFAGNAVALGFAKGLEDADYDTGLYELHDALHRALSHPKAEKRYRDGKRAFV